MVRDSFNKIYQKFKLHFYKKIFEGIEDTDETLTTVETFCMEVIHALNKPTVNEFASIINLSSPNAAYKVNNLIKKGFLNKVQSETDKREYHLEVTDKYLAYYYASYRYIDVVMKRIEKRFTPEELKVMDRFMDVIGEELMAEKLTAEEEIATKVYLQQGADALKKAEKEQE